MARSNKGQSYEGHHPPIVTLDLWDGVQQSLRDHLGAATTKRTRQSSDALLAGKLYDDAGNRMSPTWARKGRALALLMYRRRLCKATKSKSGIDPCAFQPPMSKLSRRRPSASCPRTALLRKLTFASSLIMS